MRRAVFCIFLMSLVFLAGVSCYAKNSEDNTQAYTHYIMGILYDNQGQTRKAQEEYLEVFKNQPASSVAYLRLVLNYVRLGDYDSAVKYLELSTRQYPDDTKLKTLLAFLYTLLGKFDSAAEQQKKILEVTPQDEDALNALADTYVLQGKLKEALAVYLRLAGNKDASPIIKSNIGLIYSKMGDMKLARQYFETATKQFKDFVKQGQFLEEANQAHFYLATIYEKMGKRKEAKAQLKEAIGIDPDDHEALNYLGYMYAEDKENLDQAIVMIKKALEFQPENGAYLDSLGWAYFKKGNIKEALECLKEAEKLLPDPLISQHIKQVQEKISK